MRRLFIFKIMVLLFISVSCSNIEALKELDVAPPKHPIYGKWKSEFSKQGPNFIIEFRENNILRVENKVCSECIDFYNFRVIDENSVEFDYATNLAGEIMLMKVTVLENNTLKTQCKNKNKPNLDYLIDAPLLCMGNWKFKRVE